MSEAENGDHELSSLIAGLAGSFQTIDGAVVVPEQALERCREQLEDVTEEEVDLYTAELIGLAIGLERESGPAAEQAIDQLAGLAELLDEPAAALGEADEAAESRAKLTGTEASRVPVGSGERPAGAFNPMALRLGQSEPRKKR